MSAETARRMACRTQTPYSARRPQASGAVVHNFEAVGCQFPKYGLGDVRALFRLNPLVVQIWTAIALGLINASWMARIITPSGVLVDIFRSCLALSVSYLRPFGDRSR